MPTRGESFPLLTTGPLGRRRTFFRIVSAIAVTTLVLTGYSLWRIHHERLDRAMELSVTLAKAFEDHLTHTFSVIERSLRQNPTGPTSTEQLADLLGHAPYLRSISRLDATGQVIASSNAANLGRRVTLSDFLPEASVAPDLLRIAPPWVGRDLHETPVTPSRPTAEDRSVLIPVLREDNSRKTAWIAAANPDYFLNFYERSLPPEQGTVDVIRYDGIVMFSSDPQRRLGEALGPRLDALFGERWRTEEYGQLHLTMAQGRETLSAFRASRVYPFIILVHRNAGVIHARSQGDALRTYGLLLAVLITTVTLAILYFRRFEQAARQHARAMETLRLQSTALEATANAIMISDRNGRIEWVNPAFCAISGYAEAEIIGRNPRDLVRSGKEPAGVYAALWDTILRGEVWQGSLINRRKNGTLYPEDQTITPVRDGQGQISHFIAVKQDATDRVQSQHRLEALSRHLVVVQESARRRLSSELHDRTSPNLAAITVNLDLIARQLEGRNIAEVGDRMDDLRALVDDTSASIREICTDLRPPVLDYAGLVPAIETYVRQYIRRTDLPVDLECDARLSTHRLSAEQESFLFRMAQEALTNAAKHARATRVSVQLRREDDATVLTVSDDGKGFEPALLADTTYQAGLGLLNMRDMAAFSNGSFNLWSSPGKGTTIEVRLPDAVPHPSP